MSVTQRFEPEFPPLPPVTRAILIAYGVLSVANAVGGAWIGGWSIAQWFIFAPPAVHEFEVWRVATWPWIATSPFGLVLGALVFYMFGGQLEIDWGRRYFIRRLVTLVVVPPIVLSLLALVIPLLDRTGALGPGPLLTAIIVAFASELGGRTIRIFPVPFPVTGDTLIFIEGALLLLFVTFAGAISPYLFEILFFLLAVVWFRFDAFRGFKFNPRKYLLTLRKKQLQRKLAALDREGTLRVVRRDDDDKPKYLN